MTDKVVVLITASDQEECSRIARALVEKKLAACVNLLGSVRSIYRWKEKVKDDAECLMLIKTDRQLFDRLQQEVARLHSYDTPEIICLPILEASKKYLVWLTENVKRSGNS